MAGTEHPTSGHAVQVGSNAGMVVWPNRADRDPDVLHAEITGGPVTDRLARP
jgi:hypothetical protein